MQPSLKTTSTARQVWGLRKVCGYMPLEGMREGLQRKDGILHVSSCEMNTSVTYR